MQKDLQTDAATHNQRVWEQVALSSRAWFRVVSEEQIEEARKGKPAIRLTATRIVPEEWIPPLSGRRVLALAAGGGHQAPLLAAAGADVTVVDISEAQLEKDKQVARRERLNIKTIVGDMTDLNELVDESFELIVNPCSVNYVADVLKVWKECYRLLKPGGELWSGLLNPTYYLFDHAAADRGQLMACHPIPHVSHPLPTSPSSENAQEGVGTASGSRDSNNNKQQRENESLEAMEFGHTLADLIGGQLDAGFVLVSMYEDRWGGRHALSDLIDVFLVTRSRKLLTAD